MLLVFHFCGSQVSVYRTIGPTLVIIIIIIIIIISEKKMFWNCGRRTNTGAWVSYELTYEPSAHQEDGQTGHFWATIHL